MSEVGEGKLYFLITNNYVSLCFQDKVALKREVVKYCKKCPSLRGLWFETLKFNIFFYYNVVTQKYEFSNEFSYDYIPEGYFFGIRLHEFWRYKR